MYEHIIRELNLLRPGGYRVAGVGIAPVPPKKPASNRKPRGDQYPTLPKPSVIIAYRFSRKVEKLPTIIRFGILAMARGFALDSDKTRILILDPKAKKSGKEDRGKVERVYAVDLPEPVWIVKGKAGKSLLRIVIFMESEYGHFFPTGKVEGLGSGGPVGIGTPAFEHSRPTNVVMVITRGVAALPESDKERIAVAISKIAANPDPEPSLIILDPAKKVPRRFKEMTEEEILKHYVDDEGRTLHLPFPRGSTKIYIKKDDFRRATPEDKATWGVPEATEYIVTALLPEEY